MVMSKAMLVYKRVKMIPHGSKYLLRKCLGYNLLSSGVVLYLLRIVAMDPYGLMMWVVWNQEKMRKQNSIGK